VGLPDIEHIYRVHHGFVWRVIRRFGVSEIAIDDAVQEVFIVLHRRQSELSIEADPRGLLFGIARKIASRVRERQRPIAPVPSECRVEDPEQRLDVLEKGRVLQRALEGMDEGRRLTFLLVDVEGMSVPDAAACLGVNVNTAYGRLRAARKLVDQAIVRYRASEERGRRRDASSRS